MDDRISGGFEKEGCGFSSSSCGRDVGQVFKIQVQRSYVMCKSVGIVFPNWNLHLPKGFLHV